MMGCIARRGETEMEGITRSREAPTDRPGKVTAVPTHEAEQPKSVIVLGQETALDGQSWTIVEGETYRWEARWDPLIFEVEVKVLKIMPDRIQVRVRASKRYYRDKKYGDANLFGDPGGRDGAPIPDPEPTTDRLGELELIERVRTRVLEVEPSHIPLLALGQKSLPDKPVRWKGGGGHWTAYVDKRHVSISLRGEKRAPNISSYGIKHTAGGPRVKSVD